MTESFSIPRPHGFELAAARSFYAGFVPGSGMAAASADGLTLAFRLDRTFDAVAASLYEEPDRIGVRFVGTVDGEAVRRQLSRMLGLGANGEAWLDVGARDPLVGRLQREFPGFFTAAKPSPYDAAAWALIAPRTGMKQAAALKMAMARELGDAVELEGRVHHVFPAPTALARLSAFPGLSEEKAARLRGLGEAAVAGKLEADRLLSMEEDDALAELQRLRGVGPWAASHIYYRGAAPSDALPSVEPRVLHGLADAATIPVPTLATFRAMAEAWRPFRMWVCILLSRHLARTPGWRKPGLSRERAAAGKDVAKRTRALRG